MVDGLLTWETVTDSVVVAAPEAPVTRTRTGWLRLEAVVVKGKSPAAVAWASAIVQPAGVLATGTGTS